MTAQTDPLPHPGFWDAFRFWLKLGFISFGGPTGQIAIMHTELVEKKRWISETRFLHALNYCMLLPGPEAQQLATYIGWLLHRTWGGIAAGTLFVLPSVGILWILSYLYVTHGDVAWVAAIFYGLKPAVMAIVAGAVHRIGSKALKNEVMWVLAGCAFVAIFFFKVPFPIIILGAGLIGWMGGKFWQSKFLVLKPHGATKSEQASVLDDHHGSPDHAYQTRGRSFKILVVCLSLWAIPILVAGQTLGWDHTLAREGIFFSKAAMVTFGGAYAVLPYVAQQAVEHYQWLPPEQMLDGLGLAETTPGPLIMVVQFVGFVGAYNHPGSLSPLSAATLGAFLTTWVTFVPCFLYIFLGAPYIEKLRGNLRLSAVLSAITASVVGVVLNLAVWFGWHVLVPEAGSFDFLALFVSAIALVGIIRWKWDMLYVVLGGGAAGLIHHLVSIAAYSFHLV